MEDNAEAWLLVASRHHYTEGAEYVGVYPSEEIAEEQAELLLYGEDTDFYIEKVILNPKLLTIPHPPAF